MLWIEGYERFTIIRKEDAMRGGRNYSPKILCKLKTRIIDKIGLHQHNHQSPVSSAYDFSFMLSFDKGVSIEQLESNFKRGEFIHTFSDAFLYFCGLVGCLKELF